MDRQISGLSITQNDKGVTAVVVRADRMLEMLKLCKQADSASGRIVLVTLGIVSPHYITQRPGVTLIIQGLQLAHQVAGFFDHIMVAFPGALGRGERPWH